MNHETLITIAGMKPGERAVIAAYRKGPREYRRRLLSFGLTIGTEILLKKTAPLGDPVEITVRGYSLSLRKAEAEILELEQKK